MYKKLRDLSWKPGAGWKEITTYEMHTGGEPLRILVKGYPMVKGATIMDKRRYFRDHLDYLRKGLMWEPRGHADMYGAVLTEPVSGEADFGLLFMHNEGYSTMCGHGVIAVTKFVLDTRIVRKKGDQPSVIIDAPPGQIHATGFRENGAVGRVAFRNVPSFVLHSDQVIEVQGIGRVRYDVAFGGAFYAIVDAGRFGFNLEGSESHQLTDLGMRIKQSVMNNQKIQHPFDEELSFLYGTIFTGKSHHPDRHSRNVCVFANGEIDRSATVSGVSARAAVHFARGELKLGQKFTIEGIVGSAMELELASLTTYGPHKAVIPVVSGTSHFTGKNRHWFDPADPLREGFLLK